MLSIHLKSFRFTFNVIPTLVTSMLLLILCSLGVWQLDRANQKKLILADFQQRAQSTPLTLAKVGKNASAWRYFPLHLSGYYDNRHQFLLDNRSYNHHIGYEVITPFMPSQKHSSLSRQKHPRLLLINRGWIPRSLREHTPLDLQTIQEEQSIEGIIIIPNKPFLLSKTISASNHWPRIIEGIDLPQISQMLNTPLYDFMIQLSPNAKLGFIRDWHPVTLPPEKHLGYAVQWFALAITLLVIFIVVNTHRDPDE